MPKDSTLRKKPSDIIADVMPEKSPIQVQQSPVKPVRYGSFGRSMGPRGTAPERKPGLYRGG